MESREGTGKATVVRSYKEMQSELPGRKRCGECCVVLGSEVRWRRSVVVVYGMWSEVFVATGLGLRGRGAGVEGRDRS